MKHVKVMHQPECDKLIYAMGQIARQIGTVMLVDDENLAFVTSYPILSGGDQTADGFVETSTEVQLAPMVCRVGQKITPQHFAKFVKMAMHEEVPATAYELYKQLRGNGSDLQLPVRAGTHEVITQYRVELEFFDFDNISRCVSTDTGDFYFEVYFEKQNHQEVLNELMSQLMDYMNILDTEELGCQIVFCTVDDKYRDVVQRLNEERIDTIYCDMMDPR